jgi:predicted O-methyltransferase YrrM
MNTDEIIQANFRFEGRNRNLPWYPRRGDRNRLASLLGKMEFNEGVEVGTNRGRFATTLCQANPNIHLTCVDPWVAYELSSQKRQERFYSMAVKQLSQFNVTIIRKTSMEAVGSFEDKSLDFVYIDGNHLFDYAIMDIIHWVPKVKIGGIVALHDYHHQVGCDVIAAVDAYTRSHHIDPWYVTREELPTAYWVNK